MKTTDIGYLMEQDAAHKAESTGEQYRSMPADRVRQMQAAGLWGDSNKPVTIRLRVLAPLVKTANDLTAA